MAHKRSITTGVGLFRQRHQPSFTCLFHEGCEKHNSNESDPSRMTSKAFLSLGYCHTMSSAGFSAPFRRRDLLLSFSPAIASSFCGYSSSAVGEGPDKIGYISDVAEILTEKSVEVGPVMSEVAIAAADSSYPVAALQYVIDGVHSFTGLNWWASIALTTFIIRGATVPLLINQLKSSSKLALIRPQLEEISEQLKGMDPKAVEDGQKKSKALFKKYGVTPFTPLKGLLIQGPIFISFFLGIRNMVEKVPSFKEGGAFWFTDLTTPDSLYIFPVLTALTFLITVEFNMQEGMEGNPAAVKMKKFSRVLAFLTIPFTMGFPKGIFCYWCTSNLFSVIYGFVIRRPQVKKFLNLPEFPKQPTTPTASKPAFSIFSAFKSLPETKDVPPSPSEPIKLYDRRISSTHSVLNQRIRSLEKQVKGKKKNKKR